MIFWIILFSSLFIIYIIIMIYANEEYYRVENSCKEIHNPSYSIHEQKIFNHCITYPETYNITSFKWMWEK